MSVRELDLNSLPGEAIDRDKQAEQRDRAAEARDAAAEHLDSLTALLPPAAPAMAASGQATADRAQAGEDRDAAAAARADLIDALRQAVRRRDDAATATARVTLGTTLRLTTTGLALLKTARPPQRVADSLAAKDAAQNLIDAQASRAAGACRPLVRGAVLLLASKGGRRASPC